MKIYEIKDIAKRHHITVGKAKKSELIRAIQQAEGNRQCFNTNCSKECGQYTCLWKEDCV
jgi:hypothetical protein